jgi:thiosulfate reductase cytochrome b subunit
MASHVPTRRSLHEAVRVILVSLRLSRHLPKQLKYNGAQRIAYSAVIAMGAGVLLTGLAIYKPTRLHSLTTLCGGYEWARWEHFWLTIGFCVFFLVHILQVAFAGWNSFRSMISGFEIRPASEPSLNAERKSWK